MRPYDPQKPASPETFAGRKDLLEYVDGALETAREMRRGSAVLLHGYRGSGKTSALRKIQAVVSERAPGAAVVEVPLRLPSSEAMLVLAVAEGIRRHAEGGGPLTAKVRRALTSLKAITVLGTGIERSPQVLPPPVHPLSVWQGALDALEGAPLLCVCLDDAELLEAREVGILKTMAETASPTPILLAVSGGPELMEKLSRREASPILRVFSGAIFDIGQFSESETEEALTAPLRRSGTVGRWGRDAMSVLHHLTGGYPYLVQCFAAASYHDGKELTVEDVRAATPQALRLASSWLEREIPHASDEDVRAFVKIAALGKGELRSREIVGLGINHLYISRLTKAGVLKRLARGHYELRKAPAIAYYLALRRGLAIP